MTPRPNDLASIGLAEKSAAVSALVANCDMNSGAGNSSHAFYLAFTDLRILVAKGFDYLKPEEGRA